MKVLVDYLTEPQLCPYLHDRPYRLRVRLAGEVSPAEHEGLLAGGMRRFAATYFEPACGACRECVPLRIPVRDFRPSKSQRRVRRRNLDLEVEIGVPAVNDERLDLYRRFHLERSRRRGWPEPEMDALEYFGAFIDNAVPTLEFRYRLGGRLVALAYVDEGPSSMNSVYAFSDPALAWRSLGTNDILVEIDTARARGKEHLYLGYAVAGCSSMAYKRAFRPWEVLQDGRWSRCG